MKQGIVIVTWSGGKEQLELLLFSLRGYRKYPFYIVMNDIGHAPVSLLAELQRDYTILGTHDDAFECGALTAAMTATDLDEFVLVQDTIEIILPSCFDDMFSYAGKSVIYGDKFYYFFGKFRRAVLEKLEIPETFNKNDSITAESRWLTKYIEAENGNVVGPLNPEFTPHSDKTYVEKRWGRANLVIRDRRVIKRQGTWVDK